MAATGDLSGGLGPLTLELADNRVCRPTHNRFDPPPTWASDLLFPTKTCMRDFSEAELYIFSGAVFSFCLFFGDLSKLERRLGWTGNHRLSSMHLRLHKTQAQTVLQPF